MIFPLCCSDKVQTLKVISEYFYNETTTSPNDMVYNLPHIREVFKYNRDYWVYKIKEQISRRGKCIYFSTLPLLYLFTYPSVSLMTGKRRPRKMCQYDWTILGQPAFSLLRPYWNADLRWTPLGVQTGWNHSERGPGCKWDVAITSQPSCCDVHVVQWAVRCRTLYWRNRTILVIKPGRCFFRRRVYTSHRTRQ